MSNLELESGRAEAIEAVELPLPERLADSLIKNDTYEGDLGDKELAEIMPDIFDNLIRGRGLVSEMETKIEEDKGNVGCKVKVGYQTFNVNCTFGNDRKPDHIKLDSIKIEGEGLTGKLLASGIKGKVIERLSNPKQVLTEAFNLKLEPKGVKIAGLGLHFKGQTLAVSMVRQAAIPASKL